MYMHIIVILLHALSLDIHCIETTLDYVKVAQLIHYNYIYFHCIYTNINPYQYLICTTRLLSNSNDTYAYACVLLVILLSETNHSHSLYINK